jgi:hypothetical protein
VIFALIIVGVFIYSYVSVAAYRAYREYEALFSLFTKNLSESRRKLKRIRKYTEWDWPVWPRPLLFEEIDHSTQLALGRAENAYELLEDVNKKLKPIKALPSNSGVKNKVNNLIIISKNEKQLHGYDWYCKIIDEAEKTIRKNRKAVEKIQKEVRIKVDTTAIDFTASNNNIQFFQRLGSTRYKDAIRNIQVAQECINHADLVLASANQDDLIEWAAADNLCIAVYISLSIFKLKSQSYQFSEIFEADLALNALSELSSALDAVIDYQNLHNWRHLVLLRNQLDGFQTKILEIEKCLDVFKANIQYFNDLYNQLTDKNIDEILEYSYKIQEELEEYIGDPSESEEWGPVLFRHKLPSIYLEDMRYQYAQDIEPTIQGTIIKQSDLPEINEKIYDFLKGIVIYQAVIKRIEWTVQYYVSCEREVKQLFSKNGEIERLVIRVGELSNDTANDIRQDCKLKISEFKDLGDIAFGDRKKAKYPILLQRTKDFQYECQSVIKRYDDKIEELQIEAISLSRDLNEFHKSLTEYQHKQPIIEFNWSPIILEYIQIIQMYDERGSSYSTLTTFIDNARTYIRNKKSLRRKFFQQHEVYNKKINRMSRWIESAMNQNDNCAEILKKRWNKPLAEYIRDLKNFQDEFKQLLSQLESVQNDLHMEEAINFCEVINQRFKDLVEEQKYTIEQAIYLKQDLDHIMKHVDKLQANKRLVENNALAVSEANHFISKALGTDDPDKAKEYLQEAKEVLERAHLAVPPTNINIGYILNNGQANIAGKIYNPTHEFSRSNRKGGQR